jgi:hypothetical protein
LFSHSCICAHFLPNGNHNPGEPTAAREDPKRTQGVASLCPGLSHFAPLGRGDRWIAEPNRYSTIAKVIFSMLPVNAKGVL